MLETSMARCNADEKAKEKKNKPSYRLALLRLNACRMLISPC